MTYKIPKNPCLSVFRPYDIRGPVSDNELSVDLCYAIGLSVGSESLRHGHDAIVTGRDGRLTSESLYTGFLAGLKASGMLITDLGLCTSPMLYFARVHLKLKAAAILTASHSPKHYNGLKIIINDDTLLDEKIKNIYDRIVNNDLVYAEHLRDIKPFAIKPAYIKAITEKYKLSKPVKIVVDCGNGTGGVVAEELFTALGCEVIPLFCEVDGNFPNHHPDPIDPSNMQDLRAAVITHKAALGVGFDGDADRIGIVDGSGEIILTDRILMFLAENVLKNYPKGTPIVFDIKCSDHLAAHIKKHGGTPEIWTTGHSRIKMRMRDLNAPMAGEMSAHIFFQDEWIGCDDGMLTGARILKLCEQKNKSFTDIIQSYQVGICSPEIRTPVSDVDKHRVIKHLIASINDPEIINVSTLDGLRISFANGWGLIRASLTEPSLTMRFEGKTEQDLEQIKNKMQDWLRQTYQALDLSDKYQST